MKRILFLSCTLFLATVDALAQSAAPPPAVWQRYTVSNQEFSVTLPALPAMTTRRLQIQGFLMRERWERQIGVYADGLVYTIYIVDDGEPKRALKAATDVIMTGKGWDPTSEQPVFLTANPTLSQTARKDVSDPLTWDKYTVKGEEFSVILPTVPAMTTTKVLHPRLGKNRVERHLKTSLDGVVYTIDVFENLSPTQSLEEFIAEQNANSEYDPATVRNFNVNGVNGRQYLEYNFNL